VPWTSSQRIYRLRQKRILGANGLSI
jgi:hypothetical protein